jgi:hypothetical protein
MSSSIETPLNLGLFVFASFIYAITASHAGLGSGKGGGSGQLEQQLRKNEKLEANGKLAALLSPLRLPYGSSKMYAPWWGSARSK